MTFFSNSSGFIINGGNFNYYQTELEDGAATQVLGKRKRHDSDCDSFRRHRCRILESDGLMILKAGDVELRRELISDGDNGYRIHVASHGGRLVAVKTFEGPRAKQDWKANVAFSKKCLHPNVLQIVGISDESSESHFIQFRGITSEQKMQWLIANALGTDLNTSVLISMKAVKGIAAGLSYIKSQKIPVMCAGTMNNQKWDKLQNFDILTGHDNEPIIAFHLSSDDGSVSQSLDIKTDSRGIEMLNGLCDQLFSGAHSILYDDSPKREFDVYDSEGLPAVTLEHEESTSNLSEGEAIPNYINSTENPKPSRKPRREVWWVDLGATNHSLESIGRCFEDRLNWSQLSSSNSLLHRIRSPKDDNLRRNLHQCPGYIREEITLTCDLSKSVIVSHAFPGPSERCSICHQLVPYTYSESFDCMGGTDQFMPNMGAKSSDASSVSDEWFDNSVYDLFQPSPPLNESMQSTQSMTDPNVWQDTSAPMSRRAAAAAASLTIANMLALENQTPYSNWTPCIPPMSFAAVPQPLPTTASKEKKPNVWQDISAPMSRRDRAAAAATSLTIANMAALDYTNWIPYIPQMMPSAVPQPRPTTASKEQKPKGLIKPPAFLPSVNSLSLPPSPTDGALTFDHFAPVGGTDPFTPNLGVKSSDASSVIDELFQPSLPVNEDMQSMQSMTDTDVLALPGFQWITQSQQNLGVDFGSRQTPSTSRMNAANQWTQLYQYLVTYGLASFDANNNQATQPLQLDKIGRLGSPSDEKDKFKVLRPACGHCKKLMVRCEAITEVGPCKRCLSYGRDDCVIPERKIRRMQSKRAHL